MPKYIKPISISNFPANIRTSCFGFAIGDTESLTTRTAEEKFNMDHRFPISDAFIKKLSELGYDEFPRQISSVDDARPDEYILMVIGFIPYPVKIPFMDDPVTYWDFHLVRRELDGTWVHKPGWDEIPCEICTDADWEEIFDEFGRKYVLFAFAEK